MARGRSIGLVAGAALLALLSATIAQRETVPLRFIERWEQAHPDPRPLDAADVRTVATMGSGERRQDLALLCAGLAAGCLVAALRSGWTRAAGNTLSIVLVAGSLAVGMFRMVQSIEIQARDARDGDWSLSDDVLPRLAGRHADTLRALRERIGEEDAVLLLGSDPRLWTAVLWALHPLAIYPQVRDIPREMSAAELATSASRLPTGGAHRVRWVLDLGVLRDAQGAGHPALVRVDG